MEIYVLHEAEKEVFREYIFKLLKKSDEEFVPPLSRRNSTTQLDFKKENNNSIHAYLNEVMNQNILVCTEEDELLGFVSFKENYFNDFLGKENFPNIYISTLVLDEKARGKGLTKKMYSYLFEELYPDRCVFTRTWSTNYPHIKILESFNFAEIKRIENDRGIGIDTIYFKKIENKILK